MGISKVESAAELPAALAEAFKFDSVVVCERFIPLGREIRLAVVEDESGEPSTVLPATEYLLTAEHPMRLSTDKISVTDQGLPDEDKFFATNREEAPAHRRSICPAPLDETLAAKLADAAKRAHKALRCRDFSIFDFRVDPDGEVYMLECQPVCSFARESAMIGMAAKTDAPELQHPKLYHTLLRRAAARKPKPYDGQDRCAGAAAPQALPHAAPPRRCAQAQAIRRLTDARHEGTAVRTIEVLLTRYKSFAPP